MIHPWPSSTIADVRAIPLKVPFSHGGGDAQSGGQKWTALETLLVRVETKDGLVGWGEAFSYSSLGPVRAAVEDMVAPLVLGRTRSAVHAHAGRLGDRDQVLVEPEDAQRRVGRIGGLRPRNGVAVDHARSSQSLRR